MKNPFKFLFSVVSAFFLITVGMVFALLFAQRSGKKLRAELSKSDEPHKLLFQELKAVDREAFGVTKDYVENSESLQNVIQSGKDQFDSFVDKVRDLSDTAKEEASDRLEALAEYARDAANKLKKEGKKMQHDVKREIKTLAEKFHR